MDELKERGNRPRRRGGEEDEGEDEDEVEGGGNRREEENRTTLPEEAEAAEEECIERREAKYRLRIHGLTTEQNSTVQNSTVLEHNDIREPPFFPQKQKTKKNFNIVYSIL